MQVTTRLVWVRHGESEWNAAGIWQGQADSPLTDTGRRQAAATAAALSDTLTTPPLLIARSDLDRVVQTSAPIEAALGVPVLVDTRLRELDVGSWAGRTMAEIEAAEPDSVRAFHDGEDVQVGGAERVSDLVARVGEVTDALVALAERRGGGTIVVVSHGWPCRLAAVRAMGLGPGGVRRLGRVANCAISVIERRGRDALLAAYNRVDHLPVVTARARVA